MAHLLAVGFDGKLGVINFKTISAGSVVTESMFPDTPMEMMNTYHADGDSFVMTHYCAQGVQPKLQLKSINGKTLKAFDPSLMDTSADPCVNFYQYSCGGYLKQTAIPPDESSYGQFNELNDQNELVLKAILEN